MKINIFGKNIDVTEGIKNAVEEKLGKLDKYFVKETRVDVTLSVNKNEQKVEVTIPVKGNIIRAEEVSDDMYASIDMVEETIERQLIKMILQRHLLMQTMMKKKKQSKLSDQRDSVLSQWMQKKHVFRWNFWDTIFLYS